MPLNKKPGKINSPRRPGAAGIPWRVAAPSAVWPEALPGNCKKLAGLPGRPVDEVGLCLFESRACLAYDESDLPARLAGLGLGFHAHLPLDLPWKNGLKAVSTIIRGLADKIAFLSPRVFVLHPPPDPALLPGLAELFQGLGIEPSRVLLENVAGDDLSRHAQALAALGRAGFAVCLDLGHMLAFGQERILDDPRLAGRVAMVHAYGPGPRGEHHGLARLDAGGRALLGRCLALLPPGETLMLECFRPGELLESLDALPGLVHSCRMEGHS